MSEQRNARDQAAHDVARAVCMVSHELDPRNVPCGIHLREANVALDALLTARDRRPCETCGGTGKVRNPSELTRVHVNTFSNVPCPDCTDGTIDSGSLLVAVLIEAGLLNELDEAGESVYREPLYRVSPMSDQTAITVIPQEET